MFVCVYVYDFLNKAKFVTAAGDSIYCIMESVNLRDYSAKF